MMPQASNQREQSNEALALAKNGNLEPLLKVLASGRIKMSGPPAASFSDAGDPPEDDLWYGVLNAHADGELSDEQFAQCHAAILSQYGKGGKS
jgi:hypothetical protein